MVRMARTIPSRTLFHSSLLSIYDYRCQRHDPGLTCEYEALYDAVVFPRRGVFVKQVEGDSVVADVNHALFFNRGEAYRLEHPRGCGDHVTEFAFDEAVLRELSDSIDPALADDDGRLFRFRQAPADSTGWMIHRMLLGCLQRGDDADVLEVEELSLHLVGRVLRAGHERTRAPSDGRRRSDTREAHDELVARTKLLLADRFGDSHTVESIARDVASSPYHLCRVFKQRTGMTIHRYLSQARLRAALDRVLDRAPDLTRLAIDLGYSSHSHFTCSFRREFGAAPSAFRNTGRFDRLREMSKTLTA